MGAALFCFSSASPFIPGGDDSYRHVRFANRLFTETSAALADPWNAEYVWRKPVDLWFGYHLLLGPVTLLLPLITAAKLVGSAIWGAFVFVQLRLLHLLGVVWRHAWVLLGVTGSGLILFRSTIMRPYLISWLLVTLALLYTIREKPLHLGIVSALHAFSYSIFFISALPAGLYLLIRPGRVSLRLAFACAAGSAVGLILNPFFPENVAFSWAAAYSRLGPDMAQMLKMGGELLPITGWWLAASVPVLLAWAIALIVMVRRFGRQKPGRIELLLAAITIISLVVSFRAARMFDFFVPSAIALAGRVLSPAIPSRREKAAYAFGFAFLLCAANLIPVFATIRESPSADRYRPASEFLASQTNDTYVFNTHWGQYTFLYFWNWRSRYLMGIDPSLFYNMDQERYWKWRRISDDDANPDGIEKLLFEEFPATHVLVEHEKNPKLMSILRSNPAVEEVHQDAEISVFARRR